MAYSRGEGMQMAWKNEKGPAQSAFAYSTGALHVGMASGTAVAAVGGGGSGFVGGAGVGTAKSSFGFVDSSATVYWDGSPLRQHSCPDGHEMVGEVLEPDGTVTGTCRICADIIVGRRIAGGLVVDSLRALVEGMLENRGELVEEILAAELKLQKEREALEDAERLLVLAKQLLLR